MLNLHLTSGAQQIVPIFFFSFKGTVPSVPFNNGRNRPHSKNPSLITVLCRVAMCHMPKFPLLDCATLCYHLNTPPLLMRCFWFLGVDLHSYY